MLTVETVENIKAGSRITFWSGIYAILLGVVYLSMLTFFVKLNFRNMDVVWQVFSKYNPEISGMIIRLLIVEALLVIVGGIMIVTLSNYILRKKDKNAWIILFITGLIFWGVLLITEIMQKNVYSIVAIIIGWVIFIVGILLPVRYYMQREYTEY